MVYDEIYIKVWERLHGQMVKFIKDRTKMIKNTDMVVFIGRMGGRMKGNGGMVNNTARAHSL